MSTALEFAPERVTDSGADDLIHQVCESCRRALCDGGECIAEGYDVNPSDLLCSVCEDLDESLDESECPHCEGPRTRPG